MNESIATLLKDNQVLGANEATFEDARIHDDLGAFKYIHKLLIKPLSYFGSSRILRRELVSVIGDYTNKTIIDVSAGDDGISLLLAKKAKEVVANDIALKALQPLMDNSEGLPLVFKNENLLNLKYPKADIVICKNTLHHFYTGRQIEKVLSKLGQLGNRIVIMDVENPKKHWLSRLWNAYYVFLLKDQGGFFITFNQFKKVLKIAYPTRLVKTKRIKTIKGTYILAVIT